MGNNQHLSTGSPQRLLFFLFILLISIGLHSLTACQTPSLPGQKSTLTIAFAGPMSGEGAAAGRLMTQGIELHLEEINKKGGINGHLIELKIFDDQNQCDTRAQQVAQQITQQSIIAVIGHWYSSCSINAGKVYQQHKIPAITPGSDNIKVTLNNPWYFRNIYNANSSGQFLANYVKKIFRQDTVSIIHETADYGSYLAEVFKNTSNELQMEVKNTWAFDDKDPNLDYTLQNIVDQLRAKRQEAGVLLLAVQAREGVKLVKAIKEANIPNPIIGSSSFSEETFQRGFDKFIREKSSPGFYINDIYVATPLIYDTANDKAQQFKAIYQQRYQEHPDWSAAYAYDTAMLLTNAIKEANLTGRTDTLQQDRQKIRDQLASYTNADEALLGTTGYNYFNQERDAQKPVSLGVYKNRNSVSALTQLQSMRSTNEISDLEDALKEERVLLIDNKYMYKTNVVYTGVEIREITDLDLHQLTYTMDFYIWFRFQGSFNPQDIEFTNAVNPQEVKLQLQRPLVKKTKDKITYRIYHIKSQFKADFLTDYTYKQHVLGLQFRHRNLTHHNLIYVTDVVGMGSNDTPLEQRMLDNQTLNPIFGWSINRVWFYQDIAKKSALGDPKYLNVPNGLVDYSQFNMGIRIHKDDFTLRGKLPYEYAYDLMLLSGLIVIFSTLAGLKLPRYLKYFWFLQVIFAALLLLSGEIIFVDWLAEHTSLYSLKTLIKFFDVLWWIIPAYFINLATERFVWTPLEEQIGAIPKIIRHFFAMIIYFIALIAIIVFVYEQRFNSLLATSGMLAMIIGLAIQINISNIFSGIMINLERPFRIRDWIKLEGFEEAEIVDINWRATRLQTRNHAIISLPNTITAETPLTNFYYPTNVYWIWPTVYVHPKHCPLRVKKILLDALLSTESILKKPEPVVIFTGINEWAAGYWVAFCADDYEQKPYILSEVWEKVSIHLDRAAIRPAMRRQEIHMFQGDEATRAIAMMQETDISNVFTPKTSEIKHESGALAFLQNLWKK